MLIPIVQKLENMCFFCLFVCFRFIDLLIDCYVGSSFFSARAFSSCGKRGPLLITVRRPLTIAASPVAEHRLQTRRLSNCGSRAQPLRRMWDLPRPGLEPVCPAMAGRLSTTAPPGKPRKLFLISLISSLNNQWNNTHLSSPPSAPPGLNCHVPLPTFP